MFYLRLLNLPLLCPSVALQKFGRLAEFEDKVVLRV